MHRSFLRTVFSRATNRVAVTVATVAIVGAATADGTVLDALEDQPADRDREEGGVLQITPAQGLRVCQ